MPRLALQLRRARHLIAILLALACVTGVLAQDGYRQPPPNIVDVLQAPPLPRVSIDPTRTTMLLTERRSMPTIKDMSEPMLRLAGQRLNPTLNKRFGATLNTGMILKTITTGETRRVELPDGARFQGTRWSPDGSRIAFTIDGETGVELWMLEIGQARVRRIGLRHVNAISGGFSWTPDGDHLLVRLIPEGRGPAPVRSAVPTGPVIQESRGRTSPTRTYQDLLQNDHDEALFDHYFTAEIALVDVRDGSHRTLGAPAIFSQSSLAPDGRHLLVARVVRPYSYLVPMWSFPQIVEVWDLETGAVRTLAEKPLADQTPIGGVPTGPRSHQWRQTMGEAALYWVEALDDGNPKKEVAQRDRIMLLADPMKGEASEIGRVEDRFSGITWIEGVEDALVSEYDRDARWTRTWRMNLTTASEPRLVWERNVQDRYADPGRPVMTTNVAGRSVATRTGSWVFLSGSGSTPAGDRPFLSRVNLDTGETRELWRCAGEALESFVEMLPDHQIITRYETPDEPPNYILRNLDDGTRTALTSFEHPAPQLRDVHKELVTYERADGVQLSATLYLPPGYVEGRDEPLPLIVWAYPLEYNDARTAGQVRGSPYRFTSIGGSSHLFFLLQGYAIMDAATMPVIGSDPETVNNTFLEQIVTSAKAAIDYAAKRGVADPNRVGVGGHSYGAFMTGNLLAHCDLFRAGIARSGAYNRTLTPFGFQSERRTFWEAPEAYFTLSPFMHADKINEPMLLIHGERDNNSGTFPIQSRRMYHAIKGHGGTVRLVFLPNESHGYRAEESIMHTLAEMIDWFNEHVKESG